MACAARFAKQDNSTSHSSKLVLSIRPSSPPTVSFNHTHAAALSMMHPNCSTKCRSQTLSHGTPSLKLTSTQAIEASHCNCSMLCPTKAIIRGTYLFRRFPNRVIFNKLVVSSMLCL